MSRWRPISHRMSLITRKNTLPKKMALIASFLFQNEASYRAKKHPFLLERSCCVQKTKNACRTTQERLRLMKLGRVGIPKEQRRQTSVSSRWPDLVSGADSGGRRVTVSPSDNQVSAPPSSPWQHAWRGVSVAYVLTTNTAFYCDSRHSCEVH